MEMTRWDKVFETASVEYFGKRYVEFDRLRVALDERLQHISETSRQKLYYLISYNGDEIIEQHAFSKIMNVWSTFSANDINNDDELDITEIKMMWWLLDNKKPVNAKLEREIRIMDSD